MRDEFLTSNHVQAILNVLNVTMIADTKELQFVFLKENNSIDDMIKGNLTFTLKVVEHDSNKNGV